MAFPTTPTNGQQATVGNVTYQYASTTNSWARIPGIANTISATGNISASYFLGNGSQLTGIVASAGAAITNGTSNVVVSSSSNITANVGGSAIATWASTGEYVTGVVSVSGNITSSGNVSGTYLLGNGTQLTGVATTGKAIAMSIVFGG